MVTGRSEAVVGRHLKVCFMAVKTAAPALLPEKMAEMWAVQRCGR
jgi:hypothetical protein